MIDTKTYAEQETFNRGKALGSILKQGDIVCLDGDLGVGKTAFTKGIAHALGVDEYVTSPTFSLINEYNGNMPVYHFDVYRIDEPDELFEIGFEEYVYGTGITIIEWADKILSALPNDRIHVYISKVTDEGANTREISVDFIGDRYKGYNLPKW